MKTDDRTPHPPPRRRAAWAARAVAAVAGAWLLASGAMAQSATAPTQVIVKLKTGSALQKARPDGEASAMALAEHKAALLGQRHGLALRAVSTVSPQIQVVKAAGIDARALAARLAADPDVQYAVPDYVRKVARTPNDSLFQAVAGAQGPAVGQWYLRTPAGEVQSSINATLAWDTQIGDAAIRVAVLDTGVLFDHPDLLRVANGGKLLNGFDMVSDASRANDGDGRDADAADPGDPCDGGGSSWHGTQVSGLIAALTDNAQGMAGVGWNTQIVPVRVLGRCGGLDSDIIAGMRWAAGLDAGVGSINPNPARVLNLSLGSADPCDAAYIDVINDLKDIRVVVVAAAGNSAGAAVSSPANCPGVIGVGGLRHLGTKVGFSDLGPELAVSAPGGNCVNLNGDCLFPLLTTTNDGFITPGTNTFSDGISPSVGTSFSTPLVAGVAALMLSQRDSLTVDELRFRLQASARPFPASGSGADVQQCRPPSALFEQLECYCTTSTCGAGMLDAAGAVTGLSPDPGVSFLGTLPATMARVSASPAVANVGSPTVLNSAGTLIAPGHSVASVAWDLVDGGGIVTALSSTSNPTTQAVASGAGSFKVRLTVTDDLGRNSSEVITVQAQAAPAVPANSGGGGGGAMAAGWSLLLALAAAAALRLRRRAV